MKRFLCWLLFGLLLASPALAVPSVTVGRTPGTYPASPSLCGEFTLTPNDDLLNLIGGPSSFQSFCLEVLEPIDPANATYYAVINTEAVWGGGLRPGETPGPEGDLLSPQTAYLYSEFRAGTLAGYDFTPGAGREISARALQAAIWYLEGEQGYQDLDAFTDAVKNFILAAENSGWTTIGNVRVLNLDNGKGMAQDMLAIVPAPGAILLGGLGTCLVGWIHRRRVI